MEIFRLWIDGIARPFNMAAKLGDKTTPNVGLIAVVIRFTITSLTTLLALYLLSRVPFAPSELVILPTEKYYFAEMFFLPLWGLGIWILMSSLAYLVLRFTNASNDFDKILNIVGIGMLVPMPFLWLWDWTAIVLNIYTVTNQAFTHSLAQTWEAAIQAICFVKIIKIHPVLAILLAVLLNALYIGLAMHLIR